MIMFVFVLFKYESAIFHSRNKYLKVFNVKIRILKYLLIYLYTIIWHNEEDL